VAPAPLRPAIASRAMIVSPNAWRNYGIPFAITIVVTYRPPRGTEEAAPHLL